jgi:hypothetical protein
MPTDYRSSRRSSRRIIAVRRGLLKGLSPEAESESDVIIHLILQMFIPIDMNHGFHHIHTMSLEAGGISDRIRMID